MQNHAVTSRISVAKPSRIVLLIALCAVPLTTFSLNAFAQNPGTDANVAKREPSLPRQQTKRLNTPRSSDTPEGSRVTMTANAPLNDYSAYRSGNRFYVVVPGAAASGKGNGIKGRGFEDAQVERRGGDLVYSFRLRPGAKARVSQRLNRLDVVFNNPVDAPDTKPATNSTSAPPALARTAPANSPSKAINSQPASDRRRLDRQRALTPEVTANAIRQLEAGAPSGTSSAASNPNISVEEVPTAPAPDSNQSSSQASPDSSTPLADDSVPADEIAQVQPPVAQPSSADNNAAAAAIENPGFGAAIGNYWGWGALVLTLLSGVGLFFAVRSREASARPPAVHHSPQEIIEELGYSQPSAATSKTIKEAHGATLASSVMPPATPLQTPTSPRSETPHVTPVVIPDESTGSGDDTEVVETEIQKLLDGEEYDETLILSANEAARARISAELLSALAGHNGARRGRAKKAFIAHGYFNRTINDLKEARASTERASAARALGLVGDTLATPTLIGALEDKSPEVRRAAVEALAEVRDPEAVPALEASRNREKRRDMPRQLISHAITASAAGKASPAIPSPDALAALARMIERNAEVTSDPAVEARTSEREQRPVASETGSASIGFMPAESNIPIESSVPAALRTLLTSADKGARARGVLQLARARTDESLRMIHQSFDDSAVEVRSAAAQALYAAGGDNRIEAFTRLLREATPERRRKIGEAIAFSGLAKEAIGNLVGESREETYEAFSLLFLMAKAGEFSLLLREIEHNPSTDVRLSIVKILALSGQPEILPSFRRLAVRGSLPAEVRGAVMEAIYQIANQSAANA